MRGDEPTPSPDEPAAFIDEMTAQALDRAIGAPEDRGQCPAVEKADLNFLLSLAAVDWAVIGAAWLAMAWLPVYVYPVLAVVVAGRLHGFGVLLHDACHMAMPRKTKKARLLEVLAGYPIATTLDAMRYHHLRHHRDTNMTTDPYFKPRSEAHALWKTYYYLRSFLLVPHWTLRGAVGAAAWVFPSLRLPYARVWLQDPSRQTGLARSREVERCAREDVGQLLAHSMVFGAAVAFPHALWWGYGVPVLLASFFAGNRLLVEHRHEPCKTRQPRETMRFTRTFDWGVWGRLFLFPHNIGFHQVHHLHPQAGLHRLPVLHEWYLRRNPEVLYASRSMPRSSYQDLNRWMASFP